jgi:hypothetical protein
MASVVVETMAITIDRHLLDQLPRLDLLRLAERQVLTEIRRNTVVSSVAKATYTIAG